LRRAFQGLKLSYLRTAWTYDMHEPTGFLWKLKNELPLGRSNDGRHTKEWMRHERQV
jgi:hypothetical protein